MAFHTEDGVLVPAVTAEQMREVDRVAVEEFGLGLLQMMENAGRDLAENVLDMLGGQGDAVTVLAGGGGNGGGGLCCARHLHNRGLQVAVLLDRSAQELGGAAAQQLAILQAAGLEPAVEDEAEKLLARADLVVDALIGYSLRGVPAGRAAALIEMSNRYGRRVLSLDLPSGLDATTGEATGPVVRAERTLTLALPKSGLAGVAGELYLADIGIPPQVYQRLGLPFRWPSAERYWTRLIVEPGD